MGQFLDLPVEIRQLVYIALLQTGPSNPDDQKLSIVANRYRNRYRFALPPELYHHGPQLTNRRIKAEFEDTIRHLSNAQKICYDFELSYRQQRASLTTIPLHWTRFPALSPHVDTIKIDVNFILAPNWISSRMQIFGPEEANNLFKQLQELLSLLMRTLAKRAGDYSMISYGSTGKWQPNAPIGLTVNELIINLRTPKGLLDEQTAHVTLSRYALGSLESTDGLSLLDSVTTRIWDLLQEAVGRFPAIDINVLEHSTPLIKTVKFAVDGEVRENRGTFALPVKRIPASEVTRIRPTTDFCWQAVADEDYGRLMHL